MGETPQLEWGTRLAFLQEIDWRKSNSEFQGIVLVKDRITASCNNQAAFTKHIKEKHVQSGGKG